MLSDATFPPCIVPCALRDFSLPVSVRCAGLVGVLGVGFSMGTIMADWSLDHHLFALDIGRVGAVA
jgi:hypothetical protein